MAYKMVIFLLLLTAVGSISVQPKQIIYIDEVNGTLDPCSRKNSVQSSSNSVEITVDGVELYNSTLKHECKHEKVQESAAAASHDPQCPTWFFPDSSSNGTCRCGDDIHDTVRCNDLTKEVAILDCYCMTYNESTGAVVGACFYSFLNPKPKKKLYYLLPSNTTELNNYMCGHLNRAGQLCGECKENYSIPVYSYDLKCVQCSTSPFNWILYILAAFLPLTVFFVLVVSCRLSAMSPKLFAFVFFSQSITMGANVRALLAGLDGYPLPTSIAKILLTLYGFWNLDFFRTLLPHICVKINTLQTLALDYAVAIYPLILLVATYVLIQVNTYNFGCMCRPFRRCINCFRKQWDVRTSIVEAFATFLLLSYVKLLCVSSDLLVPTQVYHVNGTSLGVYLYYDATIEYFGEEHLPYGVLAVFVLLVFIIFPLILLLLYPMQCFQRCLGCCGVRWHALPIFIDAFQGCYKDGTNGTRDCRYFAAAFLFIRILVFVIFAFTQTELFYGAVLLLLISLVIAIVTMQPYKPRFATYNVVDSVLVLVGALWCAGILCFDISAQKGHKWKFCFALILYIVAILPLFYISFVAIHWMFSQRQFWKRMLGRVRGLIGGNRRQMVATSSEESLPDRLINPEEYEEDLTDPVANQVEDSLSCQSSNSNAIETAY